MHPFLFYTFFIPCPIFGVQFSSIGNIYDVKNNSIGIRDKVDINNMEKAESQMEELSNNNFSFTKYDGFSEMVQALYDGNIDMILINDSFITMISENFSDFSERIKVIHQFF